jgi:hypothetical protein
MDMAAVPLRAAIVASGRPADLLQAVLRSEGVVATCIRTCEEAVALFRDYGANCLFVDLYETGPELGLRLVVWVREQRPHVPVCLFSTTSQLSNLVGVPADWRQRFAHYYQLPSDLPPDVLGEHAAEMAGRCHRYVLSHIARQRLREAEETLSHMPDGCGHTGQDVRALREALMIAQAAMAPAPQSVVAPGTIAGMPTERLQRHVEDTLAQAMRSVQITWKANLAILSLGALLLIGALVAFWLRGADTAALGLGGAGLGSIVASLVANPLRTIGASASRLVGVQTAYLAFILQLELVNRSAGASDASTLDLCKQLNDAVERTLTALRDFHRN